MRARFHLPDFSAHFEFNLIFVEMLRNRPELFREGVEIASVYGVFPPSLWNGGRFQTGVCEKSFIKQVIEEFNKRGVPLRFTFTNPVLEKKHLNDEFCNMVMNLANNGLNEVIVFSPLLEDYIRKNYPKYKITSSTCKRITDPDTLCGELEKDYHIVVVDYDLNNRFDVLEKLPRKQDCEILVNACCEPDCMRRSDHYRAIGYEQIAYADHVRKYKNAPFDPNKVAREHPELVPENGCGCMNRTLFEIKGLRNHVSPDDIWEKYIPMGFEQFKIEGRTSELFNLIEHYMYYMIRPECRDEARFLLIRQLMLHDLIKTTG